MNCPQCGAPLEANVTKCKYCGEPIGNSNTTQQTYTQVPNMGQPQTIIINQTSNNDGINPAWPIKNKIVTAILAILFGGLGLHKFYLGKISTGILYLIFCWTFIPAFVGFIEGIVYLTSNDHNFQVKNQVRIQ